MRKIINTTLLMLCLGNAIAQNKNASILEKIEVIDKELNTVIEKSKAAGFAIAIVKGKEVIYAKGFGYRDLENKLPVTTNTVFAIGSTTKAFTASLLGILEGEGKVDFDESPRTYIPELIFYNSEMNTQITVKDLITHRTGLPRHDGSWRYFGADTKKEYITRIAFQEPIAPVRTKWRYNNMMYMVQGAIVERLTEKTWKESIEQNFFKPLEMTNSNTSINALKNNNQAAIGYYIEDGVNTIIDYYDIGAMEPAGAINSSVTDMSNWMIAWLNKGKYNDKQVLPNAYVKAAMSSQMIVTGKLPKKSDAGTFMNNYGYGWFVKSYKGHYRLDHGGNIEGFTADISLFPTDNLGIIILTNQNRSAIPQVLRNIVADIILDTPETMNWMGYLEGYVKNQTKVLEVEPIVSTEKSVHVLNEYTGSYIHKGYGTFDVVVENDSLFAKFPLKTLWLNPIHPNVFETFNFIDNKVYAKYQDESINFMTNFEGEITGLKMELERRLDPIEFKRVPLKIELMD
ncbi:serine hydrolase, partial [Lacinutrix jangbogonensis]|uniref:serine hydrolase n=1 Tax=Lacinutrix jangbogonensis TaxID=1469557 RepID=UPI00053EDD70